MVKPIVKDTMVLSQKSEYATEADKLFVIDLIDTLRAHSEKCVGIAANMIGVKKRTLQRYFDIARDKMTSRPQAINFCLALMSTYEDYPFDDSNWTVIRHKGNKKIFAWIFERDRKI